MTGRLPVRPHLQPKPPKLSLPIALEWKRLSKGGRDPHGWRWAPTDGWPAWMVEHLLPTWGQA
jgi:hypothetical protein